MKVVTNTGMVHLAQQRKMPDGRTLKAPACKRFNLFELHFALEVPEETPVTCKRCQAKEVS